MRNGWKFRRIFYVNGKEIHYGISMRRVGVADEDVWTPLPKDSLEILRDTYPGEGTPKAYALDNRYYRIFPTPDASYKLKHIYYKQDTSLSTNIENQWLKYAPFLMIGVAGQNYRRRLFGMRAHLRYLPKWNRRRRTTFSVVHEARDHTSRRYIMGGPD